jgi:uncharacterized membrane protein (DUF2068 family)
MLRTIEFAFLWEHAIFGYALNKNPSTDRHKILRDLLRRRHLQIRQLFTIRPLGGAVAKTAMKLTILSVVLISYDAVESVACKITR